MNDQRNNSRFPPASAEHYEAIANAIDDDDVYDTPLNYFLAAKYYRKAAEEGRKEGRK